MASLVITLWETNDFPPVLVPLSGIVCSNRERHRLGLLISAVDDDLAPHADPFTFDLADGDMASNWTIIQLNGKNQTKKRHHHSAFNEIQTNLSYPVLLCVIKMELDQWN